MKYEICSFCGNNTLIAGTLYLYTTYRCEDKDYVTIKDGDSDRVKGYFEIVRYCPACLRRYCIGHKKDEGET